MKTLTLLLCMLLFGSIHAQTLPTEPLVYNQYRGMWIPVVEMGTTFLIVNNMNLSYEYYLNYEMYHIRDRQRFTVFLTGMIITTTSYFLIQSFNKKYYKRHGVYRH